MICLKNIERKMNEIFRRAVFCIYSRSYEECNERHRPSGRVAREITSRKTFCWSATQCGKVLVCVNPIHTALPFSRVFLFLLTRLALQIYRIILVVSYWFLARCSCAISTNNKYYIYEMKGGKIERNVGTVSGLILISAFLWLTLLPFAALLLYCICVLILCLTNLIRMHA